MPSYRQLYASAVEGIEGKTIGCTHARKSHSSSPLDSLVFTVVNTHDAFIMCARLKGMKRMWPTACTYKNMVR